ncbi:nucleolar protein 11 [Bombyx mori]|uniref:Nucleolar protein 11 n=1 Tax=Bombyx mori TaxID=7091 RepID=A0A8R2AP44_BOMMO|nr:nucleolar protein 11 [Bombyx mori]
MAKFHNYYVLCPLIDQKSFLGVSKDKEDANVLVTLGRNVVNKYRLSDQKQVGGWTSKDHITSAVIYDDTNGNYIGVFNNNIIKTWQEDSANLDKSKKFKFSLNILKLLPRKKRSPLIIFSDGNCSSLSYAIENRKSFENKPVFKETETIVDISYYGKYSDCICYITKSNKDTFDIVTCPLREELCDLERTKLNRTKILRDDVNVVGKIICMETNCVYVIWSDSKMSEYNLVQKSWRIIGTVSWISTASSISLAWMGKNHLILFGSNMDQDGAIIVAYNTTLGVGSCKYPMKMYTENARIYCFDNRICLEASNHIGMLPYILETKRNLSSLLGSHEVILDEETEIANWGTPTIPLFPVDDQIKGLLKLGLTERSICAQIIPNLLEKGDFVNIMCTIRKFSDIPESVLVSILKYAVKLVQSENVDITKPEEFHAYCREHSVTEKEKFRFLIDTFTITFSDALVIPHLRNGLTLEDTLFLIAYITYLLVDPGIDLNLEYESKLYDWCMLLLDSFYQQYLLTRDDTVTHVLQNMLNVIIDLIKPLENMSLLLAKMQNLVMGKNFVFKTEKQLSYTIESIII